MVKRVPGGKTYNGKTYAEIAKEIGLSETAIYTRIKNGWTIEEAVSTPKLRQGDQVRPKIPIIGKVFQDRFGNEFIVEGFSHRVKNTAYYKVRFLNSGYETTACSSHIRGVNGTHVTDHLYPTFAGVGMLGYAKTTSNNKLFVIWSGMIDRCYNQNNDAYKNYGGIGVTVCERWKRFDYFLEDACKLPGYDEEKIKQGKLTIDKDIINRSKLLYSPETCCFVSRSQNSTEANLRRWHGNKV